MDLKFILVMNIKLAVDVMYAKENAKHLEFVIIQDLGKTEL